MNASSPSQAERPGRRPLARCVVGAALLAASLIGAAMLVLQHLGSFELPGCQPGSGCAELAAGRWGSLFGWPVSYLGTAYFAALLAVWLLIGWREGVSPWLKWGVRLGAAGSVFFLVLMPVEGHVCHYCLLVHAGNLTFWALLEASRPSATAPFVRPALAGVLVFGLTSGFLATRDVQVRDAAARKLEETFQRSLAEVVAQLRATPVRHESSGMAPLRGRHRQGPAAAPIRLVIFSDYQCIDCWAMEDQLAELLPGRDDVSLVHRQYPLCHECNPGIKWKHMHPNACRAAWAAEAADVLGGEAGFWKMHHWIFEQKGDFTDEQLTAALPELGFADAAAFLQAMRSDEVRRRVEADVAEGDALEIPGTPTVFVNGLLVEGTDTPESIRRLVDALAELRLPVAGPEHDYPAPGVERLMRLWREAEPGEMPPGGHPSRTLGPEDARHRIVFWVDHQNPYTPPVSRALRAVAGGRGDVRLEVRHFPISREHNPRFKDNKRDIVPDTWPMTRLVEAAGQLGGPDAFWAMHDWLLEHQEGFDLDAALDAAAALGLDRRQVAEAMDGPAVLDAVEADIAAGIQADVGFPPRAYLDGRPVYVYTGQLPALLGRVLDEMEGR